MRRHGLVPSRHLPPACQTPLPPACLTVSTGPGFPLLPLSVLPRGVNKGWRLDFFLVSKGLVEDGRWHETYHLPDITGSDHCPLGIVLKLGGKLA